MMTTIKTFLLQIPSRPNLAREIFIFLALKFVGIYLIWGVFFSQPKDKNLTQQEVAEHILS